jgi:hypothetical protein
MSVSRVAHDQNAWHLLTGVDFCFVLQFTTVGDSMVVATKQSLFRLHLQKVDRKLIILFPMVFALFNAVYWPVCLWAIEQNTNSTLI